MSDCLRQSKIDYLDETTYLIINGYFRLEYSFNIIPADIIYITTSYIDDYFMLTRGSYQWCVPNELLTQMKTALRKQKFTSHIFKIAELEWIIEVYPNGYTNNDADNFQVFIRLLSFPVTWKYIVFCFKIECNETLSSWRTVKKFDAKSNSWGWNTNTMRFGEIQLLTDLSLTVGIKLNKIKLKDTNDFYYQRVLSIPRITKIEWNIDDVLLSKMKTCQNGKRFISPIFNDAFSLQISPDGAVTSDIGWVKIWLILCALPPKRGNINLNWIVTMEGTVITDDKDPETVVIETESTDRFDEESKVSKRWGSRKLLFTKFQTFSKLMIRVEIVNNTDIVKEQDIVSKWNRFRKLEEIGATQEIDYSHRDNYYERFRLIDTKLDKLLAMQQQLFQNQQSIMNEMSIIKTQVAQRESVEQKNMESNEVKEWLENEVNLSQYLAVFIQNGYDDMECIAEITIEDLTEIGIDKIGHQKKLMKYIQKLIDRK